VNEPFNRIVSLEASTALSMNVTEPVEGALASGHHGRDPQCSAGLLRPHLRQGARGTAKVTNTGDLADTTIGETSAVG
jgi:hypothetical protein